MSVLVGTCLILILLTSPCSRIMPLSVSAFTFLESAVFHPSTVVQEEQEDYLKSKSSSSSFPWVLKDNSSTYSLLFQLYLFGNFAFFFFNTPHTLFFLIH